MYAVYVEMDVNDWALVQKKEASKWLTRNLLFSDIETMPSAGQIGE